MAGVKGTRDNKAIAVPCDTCGAQVMRYPSRLNKFAHTFCSRACRYQALVGTVQSAATRQKRSAALSGDKAPTWAGGHSYAYRRGYKSEPFKHWRTAVFVRDGYTCQGCSKSGGIYLTAHHIKAWALYPDLRYEVANGITLCEPCHAARDPHYRRFRPALTAEVIS